MKAYILFIVITALTTAGATAQSPRVIPQGLAKQEGNDRAWVPGKQAPARAQFLYTAAVMPPPPFTIRRISLRRDGLTNSAYVDHQMEVEVWMSPLKGTPLAGHSSFWADNRDRNWGLVMNKKKIRFPAEIKPLLPPAPFSICLTLDKPYYYLGKGLLVEWRLHAGKNETWEWYADAERDNSWRGWPQGPATTYTGHGADTPLVTKPYLSARLKCWGEVWCGGATWVNNQALGLGVFGKSTKRWGSFNLPLMVFQDKYYSTYLFTDIIFSMPTIIYDNDFLAHSILIEYDLGFIPNDPTLQGVVFTFQSFTVLNWINYPSQIQSTFAAIATIGGGFTGQPKLFNFYNYHDHLLDKGARFHAPKALVMELR